MPSSTARFLLLSAPYFFNGVLGTLIGAFRAIQAKVRDSELAPRDLSLTMMGIPMGAVAGVAVGLYYSPTSLPLPGSGGVGSELTLSASGIGFLAGYGVQTFFRFMDWVLTQLFPDGQASSGPRPTQATGAIVPVPVRNPQQQGGDAQQQGGGAQRV